MKPHTRLSKFLAKIAGVYEGELEPKTEVEYYLDQISAGGNIPEPTQADAGKVVSVGDDGKYELTEQAGGGPDIPSASASDRGKVIGVKSDGTYNLQAIQNKNVYCRFTYNASQSFTVDPGSCLTITLGRKQWVTNNGGSTNEPLRYFYTGVIAVNGSFSTYRLLPVGHSAKSLHTTTPNVTMTLYNPNSDAITVSATDYFNIWLAVAVIE